MRLNSRRQAAALAERRLLLARRGWHAQSRALLARIEPQAELWIVGVGVLSGALAGLIPLRAIGRAVRLLASAASFALRTPISALFADAIAHRQTGADAVDTTDRSS